ncbi:hypothetical protein [Thermohalobacter berrensis]|uniref:Uncharacterized protein n=1 Tax=Thermohalobacter berrensis TaxID=99594 RepID=A0A419TAN4_9FIRM|nr:hypothetical protein [Thermohalobacter berrensis]RKD34512.1 hypothetical protein BET03_01385 [Thermohalobacter berrensis]
MLSILYSIKYLLCVLLNAFIIKLMDDYIDSSNNLFTDFISKTKEGILPYSLLIFAIACLINVKLSASLFLSSYIVGMYGDFNRRLTLKLKGYQESLIILLIGIFLIGLMEMISSLLIIVTFQIIDDLIDYNKDKYFNCLNLAIKYGVIEVLIFACILILITIKLNYQKLIYCSIIFSVFQFIEKIINVEEVNWN